MNQMMMGLALLVMALSLGGCWTSPSSHVQPQGPTRLLQKGILVKSVTQHATVQSFDPEARTLTLQGPGDARGRAYKTNLKPSALQQLLPGTKVRATVTEDLTIYVSRDGRPPESEGTAATSGSHAKILLIDPSYRLLTIEYPAGGTQTFKVSRDVKLQQMQPGDDVMIQPVAIVAVFPLPR